jgi:hypothetical protein
MEKFDSPVRSNILQMRSLRDAQNGSKACNDADPRPTLRNRVHRIYLTAPLDAQTWTESANWAIIASLTSSSGSSIRGCNGSACPCRQPPTGHRPFTTRPSIKSLPNGPMMGRSGRRSSPVCGISQPSSSSISACSMATGPTPWPKKGRWHRLFRPQAPKGRESHRHHRQPWLRFSSRPCGSCE